jgi:hypothetical protein
MPPKAVLSLRPRRFVVRRFLPLVFTFVFVAGCDGCSKKPDATVDAAPPTTQDASSANTPSAIDGGSTTVASADAGAKHDMGNCPTAVTGADVAIKDVDGGVEVTVTGKDDATAKEIRQRMKKIAEASDAGGGAKHDHSGSGGGTTGRCTIIMRNTKLVTAEVPNGAKVTVSPKEKGELDWVRRETKERDREAKSAAAEGAGVQRMAHCPSAVEGAKTTVKDSKEGSIVTVTGPTDKVAEIRARAKHAADVSKRGDAKKIEHSGEGTGGGGLGRCPIVVEGDTTVDVKEIEGGVEVEVKAKKDAAALQKEVKARAANFSSK